MLYYNLSPKVEAFSTNKEDALDFDVILPLHQAHSDKVRRVPEEIDDICGVDALITNRPGLRVGVKTADCVPILLFDSVNNAVAAVHSGWRGTVKNIIAAAVERMAEEFATRAEDIHAVVGPCIHLQAFEVGDEVYDAFCALLGIDDMPRFSCRIKNVQSGQEKWHIDLPAVCHHQLVSLGVKAENIEVRPECTYEQSDRFFSARKLGKEFDRQRIINCLELMVQGN